jgi:HK97 gp10 family phage protein
MSSRMRIDGLDKLRQAFKNAPTEVRKLLRPVVLERATKLAETARRIVPVVTGELRDSIKVVPTRSVAARVIATAGHALPIEFGTERNNAHPFMRPAAETNRGPFVSDMTAAGRDLDRAFTS